MTAAPVIRFDDGVAYDEATPEAGLRWLDVGCGSGAFAEPVMQRCAPEEVQGIDPSDAQLAFARGPAGARGAVFLAGDATALRFEDDRFDAAVMALVIHFVPDPAKGRGGDQQDDSIRQVIAAMGRADRDRLKQNVCKRLSPDQNGGVTHTARANAVRGRVAS